MLPLHIIFEGIRKKHMMDILKYILSYGSVVIAVAVSFQNKYPRYLMTFDMTLLSVKLGSLLWAFSHVSQIV